MARNITVTFSDGSTRLYQNVPDNVTPDQVAQRASQEGQGKQVTNIDGGNKGPADRGVGDTALRGLLNGASAGWADKAVAGIETFIPGNEGSHTVYGHFDSSHPLDSIANTYAQNRDAEQAQTNANDQANPGTALASNVVGAIASPITKIAAPIEGAGLLANGARLAANGAIYGGLYGAGQSHADTYGGQAADAGIGAAEGAAGNFLGAGLAKGAGKLIGGASNLGARALDAAGVEMTPGQILGGAWKGAEDKLMSVPILGDAIKGARARGVDSFNAERINAALEPIAARLPEGVTAGSEALQHGQNAIDDAYAQARQGMAFAKDGQYNQEVAALVDRNANGGAESLAPQYRRQFNDVVKNTVERNIGADGQMDGDTLKTVVSSINKRAAALSAGNNPAEARDYGSALKELAQSIDGAARRNPSTDPAAAALMDKANESYRHWVLIQNAAKRQGGELGTFSPGQYDAAVKQGDRTVRNNAYTKNNAFNQQTSSYAVKTLGKDAPNSFTADRLMMAQLATGGALGLAGHEAGLSPADSLKLAAVGVGGHALYSKGGNALARKLLLGARPAGLAKIGQKLNDFAPAIGAAGATLGIQHSAI